MLSRLTRDIQDQLRGNLAGVCLYGSAAAGDFDDERSDLDLVAVVSDDIEEPDVGRLRDMHRRLAEDFPAWHDRIEVDYVSVAALRTYRTRPRTMVRISPGEPLHQTNVSRHYLLNWYMARGGVALFGPPPDQLIPEISRAEFVEVVREHASAWKDWVAGMSTPGGQAYAVLTLCRALYASTHGEQASKRQAARAAQTLVPQWASLIEWALALRYGDGAQASDRDRLPEVVRFVEDLRRRILGQAEPDEGRTA